MRRGAASCIMTCALATALGGLMAGCGLLESALEHTIGGSPGEIPRIRTWVDFPRADEVVDVTQLQKDGAVGFPDTFDDVTLAHLQGLLILSGDCTHTSVRDQATGQVRLSGPLTFTITNCDDPRCAALCAPGTSGLQGRIVAPVEVVSEDEAKDVRSQLKDVSPESIAQVRLRFFDLMLYSGAGAAVDADVPDSGVVEPSDVGGIDPELAATDPWALPVVNLDSRLTSFVLEVADDQGNTVALMDQANLASISPATPQRYDVDRDSPLIDRVRSELVDGKAVNLSLAITMAFARSALYEVRVNGAGLRFDIQPEVVVDVLKAATNL